MHIVFYVYCICVPKKSIRLCWVNRRIPPPIATWAVWSDPKFFSYTLTYTVLRWLAACTHAEKALCLVGDSKLGSLTPLHHSGVHTWVSPQHQASAYSTTPQWCAYSGLTTAPGQRLLHYTTVVCILGSPHSTRPALTPLHHSGVHTRVSPQHRNAFMFSVEFTSLSDLPIPLFRCCSTFGSTRPQHRCSSICLSHEKYGYPQV